MRFKRFSREDVETYIKSGEWRGKAGGYAIQGRAEVFVRALTRFAFGRRRPAAL